MAQPYPDVWVKKMKRVFSWLDDQKKGELCSTHKSYSSNLMDSMHVNIYTW